MKKNFQLHMQQVLWQTQFDSAADVNLLLINNKYMNWLWDNAQILNSDLYQKIKDKQKEQTYINVEKVEN